MKLQQTECLLDCLLVGVGGEQSAFFGRDECQFAFFIGKSGAVAEDDRFRRDRVEERACFDKGFFGKSLSNAILDSADYGWACAMQSMQVQYAAYKVFFVSRRLCVNLELHL